MASVSPQAPPPPSLGTPPSAEQVFDTISSRYEVAFSGLTPQIASIQWILTTLASANTKPAKIIDLGCGTGSPVCSTLSEAGHDVLGIDISSAMIEAARSRAPKARFEKRDTRDFNPGEDVYDVVTIYFSLIAGVSQDEIRGTIKKVYGMLKQGGLFVFATVPLDAENVDIQWMGNPVTVSSLAHEDIVATITGAGFEVVKEDLSAFTPKGVEAGICKEEDVWEETHLFVCAKKA
ncbi:hypothetical protein OQA88_8358 [Cercophora sp. LCS_1]